MDGAGPVEEGWAELLAAVGSAVDPEASARASGALVRAREVEGRGGAAAARAGVRRLRPVAAPDGGGRARPAPAAQRNAAKRGRIPDPRSLEAAGFVPLLTSLPPAEFPPGRVLALYRLRWQVELAFKRLKSLLGLGALPAKTPTWRAPGSGPS